MSVVGSGSRLGSMLLPSRYRYIGSLVPAVLASDSVLWLDSKYSVAGEPRAINQGTGGSVLDATYGSVLGAYVYDGAAVLPGVAGNYVITPDDPAFNVSDVDVAIHVQADDWSVSTGTMIARDLGDDTGRFWGLGLSSGKPNLGLRNAALALRNHASTTVVPFADGEAGWLRAVSQGDNGIGGSVVTYYTAPSSPDVPTVWTLLDTVAVAGGTWPLNTVGTSGIQLGAYNVGGVTGSWNGGNILRSVVKDATNGTTVLDVDLANVADYATSFTATTGQTVTVNSTGADTNDPLLLTHTGENYLWKPNSTGNTAYVAEDAAAAAAVLGDFTIGIRASTTWSASGFNGLWGRATGNQGLDLRIVNGKFQLSIGNGSGYDTLESTALNSTVLTNSATYWVKAVFVADTGAGNYSCDFWYSPDQAAPPTTWTKIGSTLTGAALSPVAAPGTWGWGSFGTGSSGLEGYWYNAFFTNDTTDTEVYDVQPTDITDAGATSFTASSGQTVTVSRSTSGRKTTLVTRPVWLFGTDDYLEVADNALLDFGASDDFTLMAVVRNFNVSEVTANYVVTKREDTGTFNGWTTRTSSTSTVEMFMDDGPGSYTDFSTVWTNGELTTLTATIDRTTDLVSLYKDGGAAETGSIAALGSVANTATLRVGKWSTGKSDLEFVAVAVWDRVLTTDEIAEISAYYGTGA